MSQLRAKPTDGIVVFEKQPYWGPELKRQASAQSVFVRECRSVHDLIPAADELMTAVIVIVLDAAPVDCLAWLARQVHSQSPLNIVVIASSELSDLEWSIRESGAAAFVHDEIPGHHLAQICLRILRKTSSTRARVAAPTVR